MSNQGLQHLPCKPYETIALQDFERQDDGKAYHLSRCRWLLVPTASLKILHVFRLWLPSRRNSHLDFSFTLHESYG
jgi:hypothetical protein